jgi:hypothetical protein
MGLLATTRTLIPQYTTITVRMWPSRLCTQEDSS